MRRLTVVLALAVTGCWNFEEAFRGRCADGGFTTDDTVCGAAPIGGGTGGGGGGGPGDAGTDGGASDAGAIDAGGSNERCFGAAPWCFESPRQLTPNTLFAIAGSGENDVYFAGEGRTLIHFDGTRYENAAHLLPPGPDASSWDEDPAFTGMVRDSDGLWLVGERTELLMSPGDGGPFTPVRPNGTSLGTGWRIVQSFGGVRYLLRDGASLVRLPGAAISLPVPPSTGYHGLYVDADDCFVTSESGDGVRRVIDCGTDGGTVLMANDGGETYLTVFRTTTGSIAVGGTRGNLFIGNGTSFMEFFLPNTTRVEPVVASSRTAMGTLVTGGAGFVDYAESTTAVRTQQGSSMHALWTSDSGVSWAAGNAGVILRSPTFDPVTIDSPPSLRSGWISDDVQLAAGQSVIYVRGADGAWAKRAHTPEHNWVGIAATGTSTWLLSEHGEAYRQIDDTPNLEFLGQLPQPAVTWLDHAAFVRPTSDGGVLFGSGNTIARWTGGQLVVSDGGLTGVAQIVSLTEHDGFITLASTNGVFQSRDDGRTWNAVQGLGLNSSGAEGLARCPDDTVVVVGHGGVFKRVLTDGGVQNVVTRGSQPPATVDFGAAWCAPDGTVWALTGGGFVVRVNLDGSATRESTGWGRRTTSGFSPVFVGGNREHVFLMGDNSAILSRPVR